MRLGDDTCVGVGEAGLDSNKRDFIKLFCILELTFELSFILIEHNKVYTFFSLKNKFIEHNVFPFFSCKVCYSEREIFFCVTSESIFDFVFNKYRKMRR